jgi:predicted RNA methylase
MDGASLRLPEQLDRKLYVATNKVLEAAGGKWNRKHKAHIFEGDAADIMDPIILTGEYRLPADFGQFDSPPAVVARLMELARIEPGHRVLEPSAGVGNVAAAVDAIGATVGCIEIDPGRCERLVGHGFITMQAHFLSCTPCAVYDRVVMNPPFAKQTDIAHVEHARKFLRPGGRLVSVMSAGVKFRSDRKTSAFRDYVYGTGGDIEDLPPDSFKESGTGVNTVVVWFDV